MKREIHLQQKVEVRELSKMPASLMSENFELPKLSEEQQASCAEYRRKLAAYIDKNPMPTQDYLALCRYAGLKPCRPGEGERFFEIATAGAGEPKKIQLVAGVPAIEVTWALWHKVKPTVEYTYKAFWQFHLAPPQASYVLTVELLELGESLKVNFKLPKNASKIKRMQNQSRFYVVENLLKFSRGECTHGVCLSNIPTGCLNNLDYIF